MLPTTKYARVDCPKQLNKITCAERGVQRAVNTRFWRPLYSQEQNRHMRQGCQVPSWRIAEAPIRGIVRICGRLHPDSGSGWATKIEGFIYATSRL